VRPKALARSSRSGVLPLVLGAVMSVTGSAGPAGATPAPTAFVATLGVARQVASTVPANGDVNPYGVTVVGATTGRLVKGDILVSNFNDKANVQGTGTTIMELSPTGGKTTFAQLRSLPRSMSCPGGIGLSTALALLPGGWVVVGSLPAGSSGALPDANPAGCLIVLNSNGKPVETWSNQDINGPWDMTETSTSAGADLFVSNALSRPNGLQDTPASGVCTVVRIGVSLSGTSSPKMTGATVVGKGFLWKANKAAFVLAPTGLVLGRNGTLYVAETPSDHITAITDALGRTSAVVDGSKTLSVKGALNSPLGMALAPNGDLIIANGNDGNVVEVTPQGKQVATKTLVKNGAGDLFGITVAPGGKELLFVNDGTNALDVAKAG
jgi:hypothetical protein